MSEPRANQPGERDLQFIDALLERTLGSGSDNDEARIGQLMTMLRDGSTVGAVQTPRKRSRTAVWGWLSVPLVAAIVLATFLITMPGSSTQAAIAAIDRSLDVAQTRSDVREYLVTVTTRRLNGGTRARSHQLFVRQDDFVVRSDAWIGKGEIWAGGRGEERWLVPRFGPIFVGKSGALPRKADGRVLETPFLSVERILERAKRFYDLDIESSVEVQIGDKKLVCDRIIGKRTRSPRIVIPSDVEILIDPKTGFARRVSLKWDEADDQRWLEAVAEMVRTRDVPDDFFQHTGHHDGTRRVVAEPFATAVR
ncbi:MAG: hypothetical protein AB8G99_05765 [Planctomycetaceae bacterium]